MSTEVFLFVITLASISIAPISASSLLCISCPCGSGRQNYTHCFDDSSVKDLTCERWSHCQTCKANSMLCITCPSDRFGPTCSEKVEKQRAICGDPGIPRDGSRLNPDGSDASDPRMFEEGESVIFSCNGESFALHGTSFITCLADGIWSAPRPRCINPPVVEGQRATCDDPGIPIGGSRLNPDGSNSSYPRMFEIGESVNYTCEGKYSILEGTSYITCLADGAWSELPPRCINLQVVELKRATCIYPGIPMGRSRLYPVGSNAVRPLVFEMGESVIFTCSAESFALHGSSFITCLADGTWSAPRPRCINPPVEFTLFCADLGYISHGSYTNADGSNSPPSSKYSIGQSVVFSCNEGYELVGNRTLTCLPSGWWSSFSPFCRKIFSISETTTAEVTQLCPLPEVNPNVEVEEFFSLDLRKSQDFEPGKRLTFSCKEGYDLEGPSIIECLGNGRWSSPPPTCHLKSSISNVYCADPGRIEHGSHIDADGSNSLPSSRYLHGQSVFYSCAEGFEPVGNTTLTCLPSGWWSSLPPFCRQVFIEITRPTDAYCPDPGFILDGSRANADGSNPLPSSMYLQGQSVVYSCHEGNELVGNRILTCSLFGLWSSFRPVCERKFFISNSPTDTPSIGEPRLCPVPEMDPNSEMKEFFLYQPNITQSFQPGTELTFRCLRGYELEGPIRILCNSDGGWSDRPPKCNLSPRFNTPSIGEPRLCPVPEMDPNSELKDFFLYQPNITQSFQPGTEMTFRCLRGYDLEGPIRILCNSDGRWSDRLPKCNLSPRFNPDAPPMRCLNPGRISNGRVDVIPPFDASSQPSSEDDFDFPIGTHLKYACDDGFILLGEDSINCESVGYWSGSFPMCVKD